MKLYNLLKNTPVSILESKANDLLAKYNNSTELIDIYDLCYFYKCKIVNIDNDISFSMPKNDSGIIFLSNRLKGKEQRLVLAEEFCHIQIHHNNQIFASKHLTQKLENQALELAAYILMPRKQLIHLNFIDDEYIAVEELADHFNITKEFAHFRLSLIYDQIKTTTFDHNSIGRRRFCAL